MPKNIKVQTTKSFYLSKLETIHNSYNSLKTILSPNLSENNNSFISYLFELIISQIKFFLELLGMNEDKKIFEMLNTNNQNLSKQIAILYELPRYQPSKLSLNSTSEKANNENIKSADNKDSYSIEAKKELINVKNSEHFDLINNTESKLVEDEDLFESKNFDKNSIIQYLDSKTYRFGGENSKLMKTNGFEKEKDEILLARNINFNNDRNKNLNSNREKEKNIQLKTQNNYIKKLKTKNKIKEKDNNSIQFNKNILSPKKLSKINLNTNKFSKYESPSFNIEIKKKPIFQKKNFNFKKKVKEKSKTKNNKIKINEDKKEMPTTNKIKNNYEEDKINEKNNEVNEKNNVANEKNNEDNEKNIDEINDNLTKLDNQKKFKRNERKSKTVAFRNLQLPYLIKIETSENNISPEDNYISITFSNKIFEGLKTPDAKNNKHEIVSLKNIDQRNLINSNIKKEKKLDINNQDYFSLDQYLIPNTNKKGEKMFSTKNGKVLMNKKQKDILEDYINNYLFEEDDIKGYLSESERIPLKNDVIKEKIKIIKDKTNKNYTIKGTNQHYNLKDIVELLLILPKSFKAPLDDFYFRKKKASMFDRSMFKICHKVIDNYKILERKEDIFHIKKSRSKSKYNSSRNKKYPSNKNTQRYQNRNERIYNRNMYSS